jgi:8-oxo-dGTP diphosphatase
MAEGEPPMLAHVDIRWITPREIPEYDFCPADVEILDQLRQSCQSIL